MSPPQISTRNLLLRALGPSDYALLQPYLERSDLELRQPIFEPNVPIERVHFLEGGVASIVSEQEPNEQIEIGLYGYEGMSGASVVLGAGQTPHRSMIQVDGATSLHIASERLLEACGQSPELQALLLRYVHTLAVQAALTAAANAHYALPERLARWLLMCHDRVDGDQIELTHEFMSMMLAVRRSGVTVTLHTLEGTGAIRSQRGLVTVRDRARLEEIAGDSYGEAEREYLRLLGPFGNSASPAQSPVTQIGRGGR
jgi:CRP-like cAMP-binding protein